MGVNYTREGDFVFKDYVFEIGGRNKTNKQLNDLKNGYVVADEMEIGHLHKIPLCLFGFFINDFNSNGVLSDYGGEVHIVIAFLSF